MVFVLEEETETNSAGFEDERGAEYRSFDVSECYLSKKIESLTVWHERFAHQNLEQVKNVLLKANIKFFDDSASFVCEKCLAGKQHRLPFCLSVSRATEKLELVHADVCGPMEQVSLGGARYFLLLKVDYSAYKSAFFIKNKSDVKECIEKFIARAERETGCKLKVLRTDNGLEFVNSELKIMLENRGIVHQKSIVYTPQQNRAEREMRTLVEAAQTMIDGMHKKFWAEAVNTAVYTNKQDRLKSNKGSNTL